MTREDIIFTPFSDTSLSDMDVVNQYKNLINNNDFSEAFALIKNNSFSSGVRASVFNEIINKLKILSEYVSLSSVDIEDYYSETMPDPEWMVANGYKFWIKPIKVE